MMSFDVVRWGEPLGVSARPTPDPRGTEVLVKIKYCGVCHSDVHIRDGYFDLGGGRRLQMHERGMTLPATLGHEPYGSVLCAGPDATEVPIGADRLVYPWTGCGVCARCLEASDHLCMAPSMIGIQRPGAYADHLLVPHPRYLVDPGELDAPWAATLACSGLSAYAAVSKLRPIPRDEWVAVIGAGGLGLSAIGILKALEHLRIVAIDVGEEKLAAARSAGAAVTLPAQSADASRQLAALTGGALYGAVDFVGSAATAQLALGALRKGGVFIVVGLFGGEIPLSLGATILRALTIRGSHLGSLAELHEVVALARAGRIRPMPLEVRPLDQVSRTLDELKRGAVTGRVVACCQ
jgi:D-arabinose 1-dehydrogenase-like Zn-dependent alcohol dehydrogenase